MPQPVPHFPPIPARAHEVCGPGRTFFALALAARLDGPVLWLREGWMPDRLNPQGIAPFFDPQHLLVANTPSQLDTLAVAEEALRSGAVTLVVAELMKPTGLTEGRRLQLAAKEGRATMLSLVPQDMGSNATETRWQAAPVSDPFDPFDPTLQRWKLNKNKKGILGSWDVRWDHKARGVCLVPPAGKRLGDPGRPRGY